MFSLFFAFFRFIRKKNVKNSSWFFLISPFFFLSISLFFLFLLAALLVNVKLDSDPLLPHFPPFYRHNFERPSVLLTFHPSSRSVVLLSAFLSVLPPCRVTFKTHVRPSDLLSVLSTFRTSSQLTVRPTDLPSVLPICSPSFRFSSLS